LRLRRGGAPDGTEATLPDDHWSRIARRTEELAADGVRPNYAWGVLHAASVARHLGVPRIAVLEFGVAGGNGLVALERAASAASEEGLEVEVHGFDTGAGLPAPVDHRDTPYVHAAGHFPMDEAALRGRLSSAQLHLGLVRETLAAFETAAPVGFVAFDLDYHSSTVDALALFELPAERLMPRVMVYVDDAHGYPWGDTNGPRAAIREFNASHTRRAVDVLHGMRHLVPRRWFDARWPEALWLAHVYDHPRYAEDEGVAVSTRLDLT
jgi:hypothetical protein